MEDFPSGLGDRCRYLALLFKTGNFISNKMRMYSLYYRVQQSLLT